MISNPTVMIVSIVAVALLFNSAAAYTNHTVGGTVGWRYNINTNTSAFNYSSWAASQNFSLGDYLVFATTSNQTVVQTYNETTYKSCTADDEDDYTFFYSGGTTEFNQNTTIAVPLTIEGVNYYFSDADDGVQCERGMAFQINVTHGDGLPPYLNQPPPPPYMPPPKASDVVPVVDDKKNRGDKVTRSAIVRTMVYLLPLVLVV